MFHVHTLLLNQQLLPFLLAAGFVFYLTCQLAACRIYVVAARFAHGNHEAGLLQYVSENTDILGRRTIVAGMGKWVERYQVEFAGYVFHQFQQFARVFLLIVDAVENLTDRKSVV